MNGKIIDEIKEKQYKNYCEICGLKFNDGYGPISDPAFIMEIIWNGRDLKVCFCCGNKIRRLRLKNFVKDLENKQEHK